LIRADDRVVERGQPPVGVAADDQRDALLIGRCRAGEDDEDTRQECAQDRLSNHPISDNARL
jgi:hypothetical protein